MRFPDVLEALEKHPDAICLAAGDPLAFEPLEELVRIALTKACSAAPPLGRYEHYDGIPELLERLRWDWPLAPHADRMITAGAQSALTLLQRIATEDGVGGLYPLGFEFSGAFNQLAVRRVGHFVVAPGSTAGAVDLVDVAPPRLPVGAREGDFVFLSVPNNPTGATWPAPQVQALVDEAAKRGVTTVLDATYALPNAPIGETLTPPVGDQVVIIRSFSKVGLAGERVGVLDGPRSLIRRLRVLQRAAYIQSPKLGQAIACHLLNELVERPHIRTDLPRLYRDRWALAVKILEEKLEHRASVVRWGGGPFLFLQCHDIAWEKGDALFHHLLSTGVGVAPGSTVACGPEPTPSVCVRIGIGAVGPGNDRPAASRPLLEEGMRRLSSGLDSFVRGGFRAAR